MQKELLVVTPPIIGYTLHAYPLSIILGNEKCYPWFYSNYIQLVCNPNFSGNFFDFLTFCGILENDHWIDSIYPGVPWINRNSIENYIINDCELNLHVVLSSALNNDNYIITALDEFFIPNMKGYQKYHYYHEVLIYGYDTFEHVYKILAFDKQNQFNKLIISYHNVELSFGYTGTKYFYDKTGKDNYYNPIKFLSINDEFSYKLDITLIKTLLIDYINSSNSLNMLLTMRNINKNLVYGISIYDELSRYFKQFSTCKKKYDIRPLHILWEHKKCMVIRLNFLKKDYVLNDIDDIMSDYQIIEKECMTMRNLLLKYLVNENPEIIKKIILTLSNVKEKEYTLIVRLINSINQLKIVENSVQ